MANISRLQLDVLKPHKPNAYEFALALSELDPTWKVAIEVVEIDESTESICLEVNGVNINLDNLQNKINELGATIHSIDKVEANGGSSN